MDWQERDVSDWAKESLQEVLADFLQTPAKSRTPWTSLEVRVLRVEVSGEASLSGRRGQALFHYDLDLGAQVEVTKATRFYGVEADGRAQRWPAVLRIPGFENGVRPEVQVQFDDPQSEVASEVSWFLQEGLGAKLLQQALERWRAVASRRFAAQESSPPSTSDAMKSWMSADAALLASQKRVKQQERERRQAAQGATRCAAKPAASHASKSAAKTAAESERSREAEPESALRRAERLHEAIVARRYAEVFGLQEPGLLQVPVSEEGLSALHASVLSGSADMLALVLQARADLAQRDLLGRTPLLMALKKGSLELSRCLLDAGAFEAEEDSLVDRLSQCLDLRSAPELFELVDAKERPRRQGKVLLRALAQQDPRTAQAALEAGADPCLAEGGDQPLHLLAKWKEESARSEAQKLARKLVQARADVNARSSRSETPLLFAAHRGDESLVQSLLELHADPSAANEEGSTALMFAAHGGHEDVCRMLLEAYAPPAARNCHGLTAEEMATKRGFRKLGALIAAHALAPVTPGKAPKRPAIDAPTPPEASALPQDFTDQVLSALRPPQVLSSFAPKAKQIHSFDHSKWDRLVDDLERQQEVEDRRAGLASHPEYVWKNGVKMRVML